MNTMVVDFRTIEKMCQKLLSNYLVLQGSPWYSLVIFPVATTQSNDVVRKNREISVPTSLTLAIDQTLMSLVARMGDSGVGTGCWASQIKSPKMQERNLMAKPQPQITYSKANLIRHNSKVKRDLDLQQFTM